ncbi:MAG: thrombospondin type 3 repeat-containing protein [Polyangiaceae bacterium]|nr:thrombospondin type 3 repeat-containing protein [Polyangiaceae bacterium]
MGDLVVFARRGRTPHRAVLDADEGDVVLVLRGGLPTVGDADVVAALEPDCDEIGDVCGVPKRACVLRDTGRPWSDVVAEVGDAPYPLFGCGSPPGEVTCVPCRTLPEDAVGLQSPLYAGQSVQGDADGDGIPDADDTCPGHFNPIRPLDDGREADADGDGRGDACDPCPLAPDTLDCAGDLDGDGVPDLDDLCPYDAASTTEDRDGDGWGDACDTCPDAPNPGTVACPGPPRTIQELWRLGAGIDATLDGVCVIAVKAPERLWVQDPFSTSSGESAGLFVYSSVTPLAAAVGDRVRVTGQTDYYADTFELRYPTLTVLEPRAPECDTDSLAVTVDPSAIVPGAETELRYRYMLVRLVDVTVTESGGHDAPLVVTGGLAITSYLAGFDPAAYPVGTRLAAILGVVDYFARSQLMPRSAGDLLVEQMAAR